MQDFEHTSRSDRTYTEWPLSDPNKVYIPVQDFGMAMVNRKRGKRK